MKALFIGGTGTISTAIVQRLAEAPDWEVWLLNRGNRKLFDSKNVSLIISYTATILSIVLSLLAIVYSTIHNVESTSNLSEIRSAVAEIKATEDAMKSLMQNINQGVNSVNANMAKINNQLSSNPANVPRYINNVSQFDTDTGAAQEIENQSYS